VAGDHENPLAGGDLPDFDGQFVAFHERHAAIRQDEVKWIPREQAQGFGSVVGLNDDMPVESQELSHEIADSQIVVNQ
jgi:hypothetical protein